MFRYTKLQKQLCGKQTWEQWREVWLPYSCTPEEGFSKKFLEAFLKINMELERSILLGSLTAFQILFLIKYILQKPGEKKACWELRHLQARWFTLGTPGFLGLIQLCLSKNRTDIVGRSNSSHGYKQERNSILLGEGPETTSMTLALVQSHVRKWGHTSYITVPLGGSHWTLWYDNWLLFID